jgi:hypothetical protein
MYWHVTTRLGPTARKLEGGRYLAFLEVLRGREGAATPPRPIFSGASCLECGGSDQPHIFPTDFTPHRRDRPNLLFTFLGGSEVDLGLWWSS